MNPCPCGFRGHPKRGCPCTQHQIATYRQRLSGPLLDRFDLFVDVPTLAPGALLSEPAGEGSAVVRARVIAARERLRRDPRPPPRAAVRLRLEQAVADWGLSGRGQARSLQLARTIAALDGRAEPRVQDAEEALSFRRGLLELRGVPAPPG
jgi:magnesium chelatase family protein